MVCHLVAIVPEILFKLIEFNLKGAGFQTTSAEDGEEALSKARQLLPDLIVLDVMLPDINGKEVCQRVRSEKSMDEIRIICISGMVEEDKVGELRAAGADDFIGKPYRAGELRARVRAGQRELDRRVAARTRTEALANMLGASRQAVSHEMKQLERAGLVRISYGKVYIGDIEALIKPVEKLIGGEPVGPRRLWWNFVAADPARIRTPPEGVAASATPSRTSMPSSCTRRMSARHISREVYGPMDVARCRGSWSVL